MQPPPPAVGHANTWHVPEARSPAVGVRRPLPLPKPSPMNTLHVSTSNSNGVLLPPPLTPAPSTTLFRSRLMFRLAVVFSATAPKSMLVGLAPVTLSPLPDSATGTSMQLPPPAVGH